MGQDRDAKGSGGGAGRISPAEPVRLADLVEYGAGSVVSRTIAKSPAGTLTVFAFDEGEGLSEHTAPFDAYVEVLDGEAELTIGGLQVRAAAGETVLMPAGTPHALHAVSRFKMLLILIRG
jgi:quercetin dioxygenase-like cupin family protein